MKTEFVDAIDELVLVVNDGKILEGKITGVHIRLGEEGEYELEKYEFKHNEEVLYFPCDTKFYRNREELNRQNFISLLLIKKSYSMNRMLHRNGWYFDGATAQLFVPEKYIRSFVLRKKSIGITDGWMPEKVYDSQDCALAYNTQIIHKDDGTEEVRKGKFECLLLTERQKEAVRKFEEAFAELEKEGIRTIVFEDSVYCLNGEKPYTLGYVDEMEDNLLFAPEHETKVSFRMSSFDNYTIRLNE